MGALYNTPCGGGVQRLLLGVVVLLMVSHIRVVDAAFEGFATPDCPALTWDEVPSTGSNVYRLTEACSELFSCPAGFYCPAGGYQTDAGIEDAEAYFVSTWWDDLERCHVVQGFTDDVYGFACECAFGFWCDVNTALPRFCPKEYYCRTPSRIKACKSGHYCKEGSVFGRKCSALANCPKKSPRPQGSSGALVIFIVIIFVAFVGFKVYETFKAKQLDRANQEMEDYLAHLAQPELLDDDDDDKVEGTGGDVELATAKADAKDTAEEDTDTSKAVKGTEDDPGLDIEFRDIRFTLPNGVTIMRGVSGKFSSGRTCAIMGASGAGKTTIMNLVTGKVKKTSGTILVNDQECENLGQWKSRVAFVPQEDVMHRRLTVLQNVSFSAHLRLPANMPDDEKQARIVKTLVSLKLDKIEHSIIGDEFQRGVSGGQRKRVNVALELVADPKVCFLDEPTSGLDSVSATELCQMLRSLAEKDALTIAAVIHSPGPAAFAAFHDFLLLQTGGRPVYAGPMPEVRSYFESIGFRYDDHMIDPLADYIMKAVAGTHKPDPTIATLTFDDTAKYDDWVALTAFHELWHLKLGVDPPEDDDAAANALYAKQRTQLDKIKTLLVAVFTAWFIQYPMAVLRQLCPSNSNDPLRPTPHSLTIFGLCFSRACRQVFVSFQDFLVSSIVVFFAIGAFMAAISSSNLNVLGGYPEDICSRQYPGLRGRCRDLQQNSYVSALQFVGFIVVAANSAVAAATFGAEQPIYWREASTNLNTPAYFFAKVVADIPVAFVHALAAAGGFVTGFVSPMPFGPLFAGFLTITCFGYLSGYFLSFTLPYSGTGLAGVGWAVFWMLLYGGTTKLMSDNRESRWVWALSPGRWVNEAWYDAGTVYPYEKVREGSEQGEDLFTFSRSKKDYLFFLSFSEAIGYGWLCLFVLLFIDLFLITATKLDKKN